MAKDLPVKLEVLNGVGVSGIAHRLSQVLQQQHFKVVNTENYRTNGRRNWKVSKSFFKGMVPANQQTKKLEQMLGLKYQYAPSFKGQNSQATMAIVLGKDYQQLKPFRR